MYKYVGKGSYLIGIPARDLTEEEARQLGHKLKSAIKAGLYVHVRERGESKHAEEILQEKAKEKRNKKAQEIEKE